MKTIRVMIVDGAPLARSHIARLLERRPDFDVGAESGTAEHAARALIETKPDVMFVDADLPNLGESDWLFVSRVPLVLMTSNPSEICPRVRANAIDVLLKPFDTERFDRVLIRVHAYVDQDGTRDLRSQHLRLLSSFPEGSDTSAPPMRQDTAWRRYLDRILVRDGERIMFVRVDDIERIEAVGRVTRVYSSGGQTHVLAQNLDTLAQRLDPRQFLSIRRSTVVNLERLERPESGTRLVASS